MRPLIGVTKPELGGQIQNCAIRLCLFLSGARTMNLSPRRPKLSTEIDGLILSGGTDLHPSLYASEDVKKEYNYDQKRDQLELQWLIRAQKKGIPIFSICRGAQLLNVFRGGTLHTNIARVYENANYPNSLLAKIFFRKTTFLESRSLLGQSFGKKKTTVNSMHSQSIADVGRHLKISAREPNDIVQGVEDSRHPFIIGVQFHPEFLFYRAEIRRLFRRFVKTCSKRV